jgi:hypothetical protein
MRPVQYCKLLEARRNAHFVITPERSFYIIKGREVSEQEFEATYPMPIQVKIEKQYGATGNSLDGTKNWLLVVS